MVACWLRCLPMDREVEGFNLSQWRQSGPVLFALYSETEMLQTLLCQPCTSYDKTEAADFEQM